MLNKAESAPWRAKSACGGKNAMTMMSADMLEKFMKDVFIGLGVKDEDAALCAGVLITADKRGIDSHGIARLKNIYYDRIKEGTQKATGDFEILKESPTTALLDGKDGMGHAISKKAMDMAIQKAKEYGTAMVAVKNSTHYGIAGYYVMQAAESDMIGITGTNARPSVAPTFGVENMLGTNPLTIGLPTDEEFPFVIDCATSMAQRGKVETYNRLNKKLPEGWVIGPDGLSKTDASAVLDDLVSGAAALTPLGGIGEETAGYKGYGYGAAVEILSAALQSGPFLKMLSGIKDGKKVPYHLGHFFIAVNISSFVEPALFRKTAGNILRNLRASKKAPCRDRIYTAGEKEHLAWQERKKTGIPVTDKTIAEMKVMRDELGLAGGDF